MNRKAKIIIAILVLIIIGLVAGYLLVWKWERVTYFTGTEEEFERQTAEEEYYDSCNVGGINIHGDIYTYILESDYEQDVVSAEEVYYFLDQIETDPDYEKIKVVIIEIDSYGGSPVAAEELANKIKEMKLPVIVAIRDGAVSGGYWVASAADRIFASRMSDIGSIGVTMSYLDESELNKEKGFTWNTLSSAKFKDAGNPQKALTEEEKALFQRDINIIHEEFIKAVAENRKLPIEKVRELADGSTVLGIKALELGLIDEIGYLKEVKEYIKKTYEIEPELCWY